MFFTVRNPMEDENGMGETPCDLTKPRIAPCKNTWKHLQKTVLWCNLKFAQEKGLQFYQTSHAVVLHNTLPAVCIVKVVCVKTKEELFQKGTLSSKIATGCTHRIRTAVNKINETKTQDHLGTHPADRRVAGKLGRTPLTTEFLAYPFDSRPAGYKSAKQGQEVDREVREPPAQGLLPSGLEPDAEDQQVQSRPTPRSSSFGKTLPNSNPPDCNTYMGNRHCLLQLWKKFVKSSQRPLNLWLCV